MKYTYLAILFLSIIGMALIDRRFKLVFFDNPRAGARSIIIMMAILLFVDVVGINWQIFATNQSYVSGLYLGTPDLPIEEIFFLFLLCYFVLNTSGLLTKRGQDV